MKKQAEILGKNTLLPGEEFSDDDDPAIERAVIRPAPASEHAPPEQAEQQRLTTLFDEAEEYDEGSTPTNHQPPQLDGSPAEEIEIDHDPEIQPTYCPPMDHEYARADHPLESKRPRPPPQASAKRRLNSESTLARPPQSRLETDPQAMTADNEVVIEEGQQTTVNDLPEPARTYDTEYMDDVDEMFAAHGAPPANETVIDQNEATMPYGLTSPRNNFSEGGEGPGGAEAENAEFSRGIVPRRDEIEPSIGGEITYTTTEEGPQEEPEPPEGHQKPRPRESQHHETPDREPAGSRENSEQEPGSSMREAPETADAMESQDDFIDANWDPQVSLNRIPLEDLVEYSEAREARQQPTERRSHRARQETWKMKELRENSKNKVAEINQPTAETDDNSTDATTSPEDTDSDVNTRMIQIFGRLYRLPITESED